MELVTPFNFDIRCMEIEKDETMNHNKNQLWKWYVSLDQLPRRNNNNNKKIHPVQQLGEFVSVLVMLSHVQIMYQLYVMDILQQQSKIKCITSRLCRMKHHLGRINQIII